MDPAKVPLPDYQDFAAELARLDSRQEQLLLLLHLLHLLLCPCRLPLAIPAFTFPYLLVTTEILRPEFLNQCTIHFEILAQQFSSDRAKVAFIVSLLSGKALAWFTLLWERGDPITFNLSEFLDTFRKVFGDPGQTSSAASSFLRLRQGTSSVGQYAIQFRTLASELAWNNEALVTSFWEGLAGRIKDELAGRDLPTSLDDLIILATRIDIRFAERQRELEKTQDTDRPRRSPRLAPTFQRPLLQPSTSSQEEPMQVERLKLSVEERILRRSNNLFLYCGAKEHFLKDCPICPGNSSA